MTQEILPSTNTFPRGAGFLKFFMRTKTEEKLRNKHEKVPVIRIKCKVVRRSMTVGKSTIFRLYKH